MRPDSILIADDNADCRGLAIAALEQEGFTVREACVAAVRSDPLLRDNPIIVTTAVPEDAPSGVDAVLEKPFDIDALVRIVERHCSRFAPPARVPPAASDFEVTPYY